MSVIMNAGDIAKFRAPSPSPLPSGRDTTALVLDLVGSTKFGMALGRAWLDRFNIAIAEHVKPTISEFDIEEAVVKFTGDGWCIMSDRPEDRTKLVMAGTELIRTFRPFIAPRMDMDPSQIPGYRGAVSIGRDIPIKVFGGLKDFVGESARRASRLAACAGPDEIMVDNEVAAYIGGMCTLVKVDAAVLARSKKPEEVPFPAFTLART